MRPRRGRRPVLEEGRPCGVDEKRSFPDTAHTPDGSPVDDRSRISRDARDRQSTIRYLAAGATFLNGNPISDVGSLGAWVSTSRR
jgi:hypothetical protein